MKEILSYTGISVLDAVLPVVLFLQSMLFFLSKNRVRRWLDMSALGTFAIYWVGTLVFAESLKLKWFVTILMLSVVLVRFMVTRKKVKSP